MNASRGELDLIATESATATPILVPCYLALGPVGDMCGAFTSLEQLKDHIDAFITVFNDHAEPFVWTKKKIRQRRFKDRRIIQV